MAGTNSQDRQLTLGGTDLVLRFSVRALLALKDRWQVKSDDELNQRLASAGISEMIDIIWASALTHQRGMTHDDIVTLIDEAGLDGLQKTAQEMITASQPPDDPPKAER